MKDEEFVYKSDVREKAVTGRSARHARTHCGKGGRVRLPSDNLSKKELQKMNGECKSYRLNEPMTWAEFLEMPDDIQKLYIMALRKKYKVPNADLARMFGVERTCLSNHLNRHGFPKATVGKTKWDKDGFFAWVNGVDMLPTPVIDEEPAEEPIQEPVIISFDEPEAFVEDDLPFEEPELMAVAVHDAEIAELEACIEELKAVHEKDKAHIAWLEGHVAELEKERLVLEKQMDVVRLIFGGQNNG